MINSDFPYLGASPDGLITDVTSPDSRNQVSFQVPKLRPSGGSEE